MNRIRWFAVSLLIPALMVGVAGCGTTKWSDTSRTGTEQLLISRAIDKAVERIDFGILAGKKVYLNTEAIEEITDYKYLRMALRQQAAAAGARLSDKPGECDYILDVRSGAVGTDRNDVLVGIPAIGVPQWNGTSLSTAQLPEIPIVKKTDQRAVVKVAVFAYDRESGHPLWASGNKIAEARVKAWWVVGAGPFNEGSIYNKTRFAGDEVNIPLVSKYKRKKKFGDPDSLPQFFNFEDDLPIPPESSPADAPSRQPTEAPVISPPPASAPPTFPAASPTMPMPAHPQGQPAAPPAFPAQPFGQAPAATSVPYRQSFSPSGFSGTP